MRSIKLEEEMSEMKLSSIGPCNKGSCMAVIEELDQLK